MNPPDKATLNTIKPGEEPIQILLVDDQIITKAVLQRMLLDEPDMELHFCNQATEAMAAVARIRPTVILQDLFMPGIDGLTLLSHYRENAATREVPVVMLTVQDEPEAKARAFSLGANDYVIKLPDRAEMVARLRYHARASENRRRYRRSEARFRNLFAFSREAIFIADAVTGLLEECNEAAEKLMGQARQELIGQHHTRLHPPEETAFYQTLFTGTAQSRDAHPLFIQRDGDAWIPVEISYAHFDDGERELVQVVIRDISERRRIEKRNQRILQSRTAINTLLRLGLKSGLFAEQLKVALDLILNGSWLATANKGAIFLLDEKEEVLKLAVHRGLNKTLLNVCSRVPMGHCLCGRAAHSREILFASGVDHRHDNHFPDMQPHGHYCVPIISKDAIQGVITLYLAQGHTQDPEEEEFLLAMANSLAGIIERNRMDKALERAKEAAETANAAKSAFLATMSHEIRSPLNAIIGMGELLLETEPDLERQRYLKVSKQAGEALLALISDILDLSKIEAGQLDLIREPFNPAMVLEGSVSILTPRSRDKGLALSCQVAPDLPQEVMGDADRVRQVLLNLLGNAIKFTSAGEVEARLSPGEGDYLHFAVRDTGIGIPQAKQGLIFQPFTQADATTTRRFGGTGLGLTICRRLIEKMGGWIQVESDEGEGSTFHFEIPLPVSTATTAESSPLPGKVRALGKESVGEDQTAPSLLLVEDADDNVLLIQAYLKKNHYQIEVAENGQVAVDKFTSGVYDMVLMDIQMPVMDGYEATRRMRAWEEENDKPPTPIIALTAHALKEVTTQILDAGCDLHLTKPVKKSRLLEVLSRYEPS
ncbi:MAG: response regulator [Magnetococcales bacterium]|nr:response regulator [Magnetococcales bacterium]